MSMSSTWMLTTLSEKSSHGNTMSPRRARPAFGHALATSLTVALGILTHARAGTVCTDTIFVDGFDGGLQTVGRSPSVSGGALAVVSDGFNFFTLDVPEPASLTLFGSSQGSAFRL